MFLFWSCILVLVLLFLLVFFCCFFRDEYQTWRGDAPFMPAEHQALQEILDLLPLKENQTVYDLGCGDGRVLIECFKRQPNARYIGIENKILAYWQAKFHLFLLGNPANIKIIRGDFFAQTYQDADLLYLYLLPKTLEQLYPKLEQELKPGTPIFCPTFAFPQQKPDKIIYLSQKRGTFDLIKRVNLYHV